LFLDHKSPRLDSIKQKYETTKLKRDLQRQTSLEQNANRIISDVANKLINIGTIETPISSSGASATSNRKTVQPSSTRKIVTNSSRPNSAISGHAQSSTSTNRPITSNKITKPTTNNLRNSTTAATGVTQQAKVPITKKLKIPNVEERLVNFIIDEIVDVGQSVKFSDVGQLILKFSIFMFFY
jgi:hypothetical protein